jgi:hypothetical protein
VRIAEDLLSAPAAPTSRRLPSVSARSMLLVLAIAGPAIAGCGGQGATTGASTVRSTSVVPSTNPAPSTRPSAAVSTFQRRGQALCRESLRASTKGAQQSATTPTALAAAERQALAASAHFYHQLEALDAPRSLTPYVRQYLTLEHHDDAVWRRIVARLDAGTPIPNAIGPDQSTVLSDVAQGNALVTRLGLTDCVTG